MSLDTSCLAQDWFEEHSEDHIYTTVYNYKHLSEDIFTYVKSGSYKYQEVVDSYQDGMPQDLSREISRSLVKFTVTLSSHSSSC